MNNQKVQELGIQETTEKLLKSQSRIEQGTYQQLNHADQIQALLLHEVSKVREVSCSIQLFENFIEELLAKFELLFEIVLQDTAISEQTRLQLQNGACEIRQNLKIIIDTAMKSDCNMGEIAVMSQETINAMDELSSLARSIESEANIQRELIENIGKSHVAQNLTKDGIITF